MTGGLLVFALPQSGSGLLAEVLSAHPALRCAREPLSRAPADPAAHRPVPTLAQLDALLRGAWAESPVIEHVWDPSGWPFPRHSPQNGHVLLAAARVVLLSRRNLLQLVVEDAVARRGAPAPPAGGAPAAEPLDIAPLRWQLKQIPPALRTHRRALYVRGRPVLDLTYEDLFGAGLDLDARLAAVERVFEFLGHGTGEAGVNRDEIRRRLDTAASADVPWRWIPNLEAIEQQLGADETGWLLR